MFFILISMFPSTFDATSVTTAFHLPVRKVYKIRCVMEFSPKKI